MCLTFLMFNKDLMCVFVFSRLQFEALSQFNSKYSVRVDQSSGQSSSQDLINIAFYLTGMMAVSLLITMLMK